MKWLRNVPLARKLLVIGLLFTVPIVWLLAGAVNELRQHYAATLLEIDGVDYLRPLIRLIEGLRTHELLAHLVASGKAEEDAERAAAETKVDELIASVAAVDRRLGGVLQFDEDSLSQRGRSGASAAGIQREWDTLKGRRATATPEVSDRDHEAILNNVLNMIRHAFETSGLLVDPDAETFYLAYVMAQHMPLIQAQMGGAMKAGVPALEKKPLSTADRVELAGFEALMDFNRMSTVVRIQSSLNEDASYNGVSKSFQSRVPDELKAFDEDARRFGDLTHRVDRSETTGISAAAYRDAGRKLAEDAPVLDRPGRGAEHPAEDQAGRDRAARGADADDLGPGGGDCIRAWSGWSRGA